MRLALLATALSLTVLSACNRGEAPAPATPPVADETPAPPAETPDAGITMRYACDGHQVAVHGNDHVTVTMDDGRSIDLAYVADSSPPRFSGEALEFSVGSDGAVLGQDEGANWACTAE